MRRCDQTEIFVAQYASSHGGNFPKIEEIATALGSSRGNAFKWIVELVASERLIDRDGHYWIADGTYQPPERLKGLIGATQFESRYRSEIAQEDVKLLYKSQKGLCWWCSEPLLGVYQIDHRVPLAKGGDDNPGNLCLSCPNCNCLKSNKLPHEFNGRLL